MRVLAEGKVVCYRCVCGYYVTDVGCFGYSASQASQSSPIRSLLHISKVIDDNIVQHWTSSEYLHFFFSFNLKIVFEILPTLNLQARVLFVRGRIGL